MKTFHVQNAFERSTGVGLQLCAVKSEKSNRNLRLPAMTGTVLREQQERQQSAKAWAGSGWREGNFVFTTSIGTPLQEKVNTELAAVLAAAGSPRSSSPWTLTRT